MPFERLETRIDGVGLIQPRLIGDERGFFVETYRRNEFAELGIDEEMVQDNHSRSKHGIVRGMHFQIGEGASKLVRCGRGTIVDVVVDLRRGSPTFGEWEAFELSDENGRIVYCPIGFAHGFCVVSDVADVFYKQSNYYSGERRARLQVRRPRGGDRVAAADGGADPVGARRERRRRSPRWPPSCPSSTARPSRDLRRRRPRSRPARAQAARVARRAACGPGGAGDPDVGARDLDRRLAPAARAAQRATRVFLGLAGETPLFADDVSEAEPADGRPAGLREAATELPAEEAALAGYAGSLLAWHRRHRFCANCGTPTEPRDGGHERHCPACDAHHFPRTDPVVIVRVTDARGPAAARAPGALAGRALLAPGRLRGARRDARGGRSPRGARGVGRGAGRRCRTSPPSRGPSRAR